MKFFWTVVLLALPFGTPAIAQSQTLEPIERWEKRNPNWASDRSELGYIGTRCGALFGVIGAVFSNKPAKADDTKLGTDVMGRGVLLMMVGSHFSEQTGWSTEKLGQRREAISNAYMKTVSENRTVHNNMFHGFVEGDWKFCLQFESMMKEVAKTSKK